MQRIILGKLDSCYHSEDAVLENQHENRCKDTDSGEEGARRLVEHHRADNYSGKNPYYQFKKLDESV